MITLPAASTALVLIDLQNGILNLPIAPYTGAEMLSAGKALAECFRAAGAPVVLVNVAFAPDFSNALKAPVDKPMTHAPGGLPADWADLAEGLAQPSDILITKRQWGAFYGTALDLELRRRGVKTIVLAGVATNMGVESTARAAHEHGYAVVVVEDAMSSLSAEMHSFAVEKVFPMMSRVTHCDGIELQS